MLPRSTWSDLHSARHTGPSVEEGEREAPAGGTSKLSRRRMWEWEAEGKPRTTEKLGSQRSPR